MKFINQFNQFAESDLFPFLVTLITCLFWSLEYGILCGIGANLIYILYSSARPQVYITLEKVYEVYKILEHYFSS